MLVKVKIGNVGTCISLLILGEMDCEKYGMNIAH